jgi:hypothetical protein
LLKYLENIDNFDEENQLSVFQGKIGQFSKIITQIIVRLTRERKTGREKAVFQ